jgi:DNA repair exonuclease SbcCD ATPase subunit
LQLLPPNPPENDKNNINCYLLYGTSDKWPVELSSGMERFVVSIATRVALINITSLPRPNFLAIDEGFGVMDSDNVNSLNQLFDYLKNQFDFIIGKINLIYFMRKILS